MRIESSAHVSWPESRPRRSLGMPEAAVRVGRRPLRRPAARQAARHRRRCTRTTKSEANELKAWVEVDDDGSDRRGLRLLPVADGSASRASSSSATGVAAALDRAVVVDLDPGLELIGLAEHVVLVHRVDVEQPVGRRVVRSGRRPTRTAASASQRSPRTESR